MIIFVDLEHECVAATPAWEESFARRLRIQYRLEDIAGEPCLTQRYFHVTPALVHALNPRAVVISGCATEITYYDEAKLAGLRQVLRDAAQPILGFCGGLQLMAQTYGVEIAPMGPLAPGQPDPYPEWDYGQGMRRERGFMPVQACAPHPLWDGLGATPLMFESHFWEVKSVPAGFQLAGTTAMCPVQLLVHESKPLYATQFHPEAYEDGYEDGRRFLANFFRMIGAPGA
ncbi:MAG: hypothetical protein JNK29_01215 [Anaerolineales bacterium]|nr:hypothetical protein [Anaerolineales bacterium]